MIAKAETILPDGVGATEERIRNAWRDFYRHEIDEATRKKQLEGIIKTSPPDIQSWLFETVDGRDNRRPINRMMKIATEELVRATQPRSKGGKTFVRREKAIIRRG